MENLKLGVNLDIDDAQRDAEELERLLKSLGDKANKSGKKSASGFKELGKSLRVTKKDIKSLSKEMSRQTKVVNSFAKSLGKAGLVGALGGVASSLVALKSTVEKSKVFYDLQRSTGLATDALVAYSRQAEITGGSIDNMSEAVKTFTERLGEAKLDEGSSWAKSFDKMGVSITKGVNSSLEETLKYMGELVDKGKEAEALFIGRDLMGNDFDLSGFSRAVQGGSAGVSALLTQASRSAKTLIPQRYLDIFARMGTSLSDLKKMVAVHIAPWTASIANGINNIAGNIYSLLSNTDPKTLEDANEAVIKAITGSIVWFQDIIKNPLKKLGTMFQDYTYLFTTTMYSIAGLLMGILTSLGPLALMGLLLESVVTLGTTLISYGTLFNPLASESSKINAKNALKSIALKEMNKDISNLKGTISSLEESLKQSDISSEKRLKMEKELEKAKETLNKKESRRKIIEEKSDSESFNKKIEELDRKINDAYKATMDKKSTKQERDDAKKLHNELRQDKRALSKQNPDPTVLEMVDALKGPLIQIALSGGASLGAKIARDAVKSGKVKDMTAKGIMERLSKDPRYQSSNEAFKKAAQESAMKTHKQLTKIQAQQESVAKGIEKAVKAGKYSLLLPNILNLHSSLSSLNKPLGDFTGLTEEEIKAHVEKIFKLPERKSSTSKGEAPTGATPADVETDSDIVPAESTFIDYIFGTQKQMDVRQKSIMNGVTDFGSQMIDYFDDYREIMYRKKMADFDRDERLEQDRYDNQIRNFIGSRRAMESLSLQHSEEMKKIDKERRDEQKRQEKRSLWINSFNNQGMAFANAVGQFGFPAGPIIGGAMASAILTQTAVSSSMMDKYRGGGLLDGHSHANGGIKTPYGELEGNEAVINRRSTSMFKDELSAINEAGGGRSFGNSRNASFGNTNYVHIENFSGGDSELQKLEDMLYQLNSNNVLNDNVFA